MASLCFGVMVLRGGGSERWTREGVPAVLGSPGQGGASNAAGSSAGWLKHKCMKVLSMEMAVAWMCTREGECQSWHGVQLGGG